MPLRRPARRCRRVPLPKRLALARASPYIDVMTRRKGTGAKRRARATVRKRPARKHANPWRHVVKAQLANFELVKAGSSLRLQIFSNEEKIGQLEVGRGSLYWNGRNRKSRERVDWSRFADMMDELAYGK
jgi:hypothetical protein